jgi:hypothetical protein
LNVGRTHWFARIFLYQRVLARSRKAMDADHAGALDPRHYVMGIGARTQETGLLGWGERTRTRKCRFFVISVELLGFTEHFRTRDFLRTPGRDRCRSRRVKTTFASSSPSPATRSVSAGLSSSTAPGLAPAPNTRNGQQIILKVAKDTESRRTRTIQDAQRSHHPTAPTLMSAD